jgi:tryptophan synthase alpha chain
VERFYRDARSVGVDGILIADMPLEESGEALKAAKKHGIDQIFLVTQTTSDERLQKIVAHAGGFLYLVSVLGVTGARSGVPEAAFDLIRRVKAVTHIPVALGFGISGPDEVKACAAHGADGVIVGSAIVDIIERTMHNPDAMEQELAGFISRMKQAAGGSRPQ